MLFAHFPYQIHSIDSFYLHNHIIETPKEIIIQLKWRQSQSQWWHFVVTLHFGLTNKITSNINCIESIALMRGNHWDQTVLTLTMLTVIIITDINIIQFPNGDTISWMISLIINYYYNKLLYQINDSSVQPIHSIISYVNTI